MDWYKWTKWHHNYYAEERRVPGICSANTLWVHTCYGQPFASYRSVWDNCSKWPQMTLNTARSEVPHICLVKPPGPKFQPMWPWALQGQTHICSTGIPESYFGQFCSNHFELYVIWDICTKWSQNDLKHYEVKSTYIPIYVLLSSQSQISVNFALLAAICELLDILRQMHRMAPKWPSIDIKHLKHLGQRAPNMPYEYSEVPNINPFGDTASRIRVAGVAVMVDIGSFLFFLTWKGLFL